MNNVFNKHQDKGIEHPLDIPTSVAPEGMDQLPDSPFWSTLWKFARPCRRPLILAVVCAMLVGVIIPLQMQYTVKRIIDTALEQVSIDMIPKGRDQCFGSTAAESESTEGQ